MITIAELKMYKEYIMKRYGKSYETGCAKMRMVEEAKEEAFDKDGKLKPEYTLSYEEKVAVHTYNEIEARLAKTLK